MIKLFRISCRVGRVKSSMLSTLMQQKIFTDNLLATPGLNFKKEQIIAAVDHTPGLSQTSPSKWVSCYNTLLAQGFKSEDFIPMIQNYPSLLYFKPDKIERSLVVWRNCQFGEKQLLSILVQCPVLLDASEDIILKKIPQLESFAGNKKNVCKLIIGSPILAFESVLATEQKLVYLLDVMRVDKHEIIKSSALGLNLDDLKCRHIFLQRLGLYEPKSLKADPNEPSKNPRIYKITDTTDKHFAVKVARVTLEEFEVFQQLIKKELAESGTDSDSSTDSDKV